VGLSLARWPPSYYLLQVRKLFPTIVHFLHMQQACLFRIDSYRNKFWVIFFLHWESIKSTSYETFLILKRVIHVYKKVSNATYSMTNKKHGEQAWRTFKKHNHRHNRLMGFTCLAYHTPSNEYWSNLMEYESQWGFVATWLAVTRLFTWTVLLVGQSFFRCKKDVKVMLVFF